MCTKHDEFPSIPFEADLIEPNTVWLRGHSLTFRYNRITLVIIHGLC